MIGLSDLPGAQARLFEPLAEADISIDVRVQNVSVDGATDLTFTVNRTDLRKALDVVEALSSELGIREVASSSGLGKVSIVGRGCRTHPGTPAGCSAPSPTPASTSA